MSVAEDAGIDCKICRGPPEPNAPLYSPCKCKGSIGSVHESCLFDWLQVNDKSSSRTAEKCEVCGTPFRFQKIYKHVPQHLPYQLIIKQLGRTVVWAALLLARFVLVAFCWVGLVPWCTVWTFRFLLFTGTSLTYVLTGANPRTHPIRDTALDLLSKTQNVTSSTHNETIQVEIKSHFHSLQFGANNGSGQGDPHVNRTTGYWDTAKDIISNAGKDCFTGQIIMCAVVIVFIAVFLLREWINQQQPAEHVEHPDADADAVAAGAELMAAAAANIAAAQQARAEPTPENFITPIDEAQLLHRYSAYATEMQVSEAQLLRLIQESKIEVLDDLRQEPDLDRDTHVRYMSIVDRRLMSRINSAAAERDNHPTRPPANPMANDANGTFAAWSPPEELRRTGPLGMFDAESPQDTSSARLDGDHAQSQHQGTSPPFASDTEHEANWTTANYPASSSSSISRPDLDRRLSERREGAPRYINLGPAPWERRAPFQTFENNDQLSPQDDLARVARVFDDQSSSASSDAEPGGDTHHASHQEQLRQQLEAERDGDFTPLAGQHPHLANDLLAEAGFAPLQRDTGRDGGGGDRTPVGEEPEDADADADVDLDEGEDDNWMDVFDPQDEDAAALEAVADDAEAGLDDFDGILEAVGLRGNLLVLFQTVALMHLFITVFLMAAVWLPFIIGRLLLGLNAFYYTFVGPVKVVRTVTDPLVDYVALALSKVSDVSVAWLQPVLSRFPSLPAPAPASEVTFLTKLIEPFKAQLVDNVAATQDIWISMAHNDEPLDRVLCISLGYVVTGMLAGLWYYRDSHLERPWSRRIQHHISSYGVLLKVAMFVVVELVAFPAVCGVCLNLMSIPLWKDVSVASRVAFQARAPYSSGFLHWAAGTLFMFVVAQWIALCRSTLRKGALFFIRDPRDPESHPIKEMVEQSISTQFSKLGKSVLLYAALMANFLIVALVFHAVYPGLLPLRWRANEPLLALPLDILLAILVIPTSAKALKPVRTLRILFTRWTKFSVHKMRLSAFFLGERVPSEEGSYVYRTWWQALTLGCGSKELPEWKPSGDLCRVPKSDHIKLLPGRPSTIPVDEEGNAKTEEGAAAMAAQKEAGLTEEDFETVYTPPRFRWRLVFALYSLWVAGATFTVALVTAPLLMGRGLISALIGRTLHDGYAFLIGAYVLYPALYFAARSIRRANTRAKKRRNRRASAASSSASSGGAHKTAKRFNDLNLRTCLTAFKRHTSRIASRVHGQGALIWAAVRTGFLGGLVLPLLVGTHFYLVCSPLTTPRGELPTLWLPMLWCSGVAEMALVYALSRSIQPEWHPFVTRLDIFAERFAGVSQKAYLDTVYKNLVVPEVLAYVTRLLAPSLLVCCSFGLEDALRARGLNTSSEWFLSRQTMFKCSFAAHVAWSLQDSLRAGWQALSTKWLQALRDQEFLIERHILNYTDPSSEEEWEEEEEVVVDGNEEDRLGQPPPERLQDDALMLREHGDDRGDHHQQQQFA